MSLPDEELEELDECLWCGSVWHTTEACHQRRQMAREADLDRMREEELDRERDQNDSDTLPL